MSDDGYDSGGYDWSTALEDTFETLAGLLPYVGSFATLVVELIWPQSSPVDTWSSIAQQVQHSIDRSIVESILNQKEADLESLHLDMVSYRNAQGSEKGQWLVSILSKCSAIQSELRADNVRLHSIPICVSIAYIRLAMLRDRYNLGQTIFGADNRAIWLQELRSACEEYFAYFRAVVTDWKSWRLNQIKTWDADIGTALPEHYTYLKDELRNTGNYVCHRGHKASFIPILKARIMADAMAEMTRLVAPSFKFHRFLPEYGGYPAIVDPQLAEVWIGPYSDATMITENLSAVDQGDTMWTTNVEDKPALEATKALVRHFNSIDALRFTYGNKVGAFVGSQSGGLASDFNEVICEVNCTYWRQSILWALQLGSRRSESPVFGGSHNPSFNLDHKVRLSSEYRLCGAKMRQGPGPSNTTGIRVMSLRFQHVDHLKPVSIKSVACDKVLDITGSKIAENGAEALLWGSKDSLNQKWYMIYLGDKTWLLRCVESEKVLDLNVQTQKLTQWERNDGTNQMWILTNVQDKRWKVESKSNHKFLTAVDIGNGNFSPQLRDQSNRDDQIWLIE